MSLKQKTINAVKWTTFASIFVSILQVVQVVILTKLLNPEDFGMMAIVLFVANFSINFVDFGISNAVIHRQNISRNGLSSLYILNIFIGLLVFGLIFLSSDLVASIYQETGLKTLIQYISLIFLILPFGQQFQVLLRKELQFKSIAVRDIISRSCGFLVTIVLAYQGWGVFSLVYGYLINTFIATITIIIAGLKYHRPKFYFHFGEIKPFISFGLFQMGEKVVNYLNKEVDTLIVGKLLGMEILGIYNIAKDFISKPHQLINPIITKVSFPVMAKLQDNLLKMKEVYLETLKHLAFVNCLIFFFCCFFAEEIVWLFFGSQWEVAVPVLRILSIYMLFRSIGNPVGSLQLALGRADLGFYWNIVLLLLVPLCVYLGHFWGIVGVAWALLICQAILYYPSWKYMIYQLAPISFKDYLRSHAQFWIIGVASTSLAFCGVYFLDVNDFMRFLIGGSVSVSVYVWFVYLWDRGLIKNIFSVLANR